MKMSKVLLVFIIVGIFIVSSWYIFIYENNDNDKEDSDIHDENGTNDKIPLELNFSVENYPRVDGSTSAHPLASIIACKLLNVSYLWQTNRWDNTNRIVPNSSENGKEYIAENITKEVVHHGTHGGYENLIQNNTDLILVARLPSKDELELANEFDVEMDIKPIALDAFVFILNINNPVTNLTIDQIQRIYTGDIIHWDEVGGEMANITPYQRDPNSGSQELMKNLVMKDLEMVEARNLILYGMMGPINMLSRDEIGICYSVYFFEEFMAPNQNIKLCGINDIMPNYENIKTRKYPFTTEVYVVTRKDLEKNSTAYQLREWLLTEDGQDIVKESGYVPII
jgi:phosphate transport system substrate-binding protein